MILLRTVKVSLKKSKYVLLELVSYFCDHMLYVQVLTILETDSAIPRPEDQQPLLYSES